MSDQRLERTVRTRQRFAAPLIGLLFVGITWSVPTGEPYSTHVWQIIRILFYSPGFWLSSFGSKRGPLLIEILNFVFYAGAAYLLMRCWSLRDNG